MPQMNKGGMTIDFRQATAFYLRPMPGHYRFYGMDASLPGRSKKVKKSP